jgi:hypothetical protein
MFAGRYVKYIVILSYRIVKLNVFRYAVVTVETEA